MGLSSTSSGCEHNGGGSSWKRRNCMLFFLPALCFYSMALFLCSYILSFSKNRIRTGYKDIKNKQCTFSASDDMSTKIFIVEICWDKPMSLAKETENMRNWSPVPKPASEQVFILAFYYFSHWETAHKSKTVYRKFPKRD